MDLFRVGLTLAAAYAALGVLWAIYFCTRGVRRFDAGAAHAPAMFYWLIAPGVVALWPVLVVKSLRAGEAS